MVECKLCGEELGSYQDGKMQGLYHPFFNTNKCILAGIVFDEEQWCTLMGEPEPESAEPVLWFLPHNDGSYSTQKEKPSNIGPHSDWLPLCAHATKQEQWIPVSEQQPPTDEPVLYMRKGERKISVGIAYWSVSSKWIPESQSVHCPNGFTHWMPLPQPPQE